jgi:hypothetical protein
MRLNQAFYNRRKLDCNGYAYVFKVIHPTNPISTAADIDRYNKRKTVVTGMHRTRPSHVRPRYMRLRYVRPWHVRPRHLNNEKNEVVDIKAEGITMHVT